MKFRQLRSSIHASAGPGHTVLAVVPWLVLGLVTPGCGSTEQSTRSRDDSAPASLASAPMNTSYKPGSHEIPSAPASARASEMQVDLEVGFLDENDIQEAIERNWRSLTHCYQRAGAAQRYVGGEVRLQFVVKASGAVDDIHVVANGLGNYAVERCLVVEGRRIAFRAPEGGKTATFEYPINFRSSRELSVVDWPPDALAGDITALLEKLNPCPSLGPSPVRAVAYIEPSGQVGSAGLVSAGPIDPGGGMCALEQIRAWRLPGDPGHVVRTTFGVRLPDARRAVAAPAPAAVPERRPSVREDDNTSSRKRPNTSSRKRQARRAPAR